MNFYQLTYFIEAVKSGSLNKAARELNVNPSTLTIALNNLEKEIGCSLMERSHKGIFLTHEGELFFEDAIKILEFQVKWENRKKHPLPNFFDINLLCIPVIYNAVMMDICWKMAETMPNINLIPYEKYVSEIYNAIIKRWPELIITSYPESEQQEIISIAQRMNLQYRILLKDTWKAFMSSSNPMAQTRDISVNTLKTMKGVVSSYHLYNYNNLQVYDLNNVIYLYRQKAALHCAACSERFTLQPSLARFDPYVKSGMVKMLNVTDASFTVDYVLLWPNHLMENKIYKFAIDFITDYFINIKY